LAICFGCAISSTLSAADLSGRRRRRRAAVQLKLAFCDPPDPPLKPPASRLAPIPWERIDAAARRAALDVLALLIARMLAAAANGAGDE
jgi:hypothetical protein